MKDGSDKKDEPQKPGFKKFPGAKLVPLPSPVSHTEKESFPVFLGVGIVLSLLVLVTVIVLAFTSPKVKSPPPDAALTPESAPVPAKTAH